MVVFYNQTIYVLQMFCLMLSELGGRYLYISFTFGNRFELLHYKLIQMVKYWHCFPIFHFQVASGES